MSSATWIIAIVVAAAVGGVIGWLLSARSAPADTRALDAEARAKALQEQVESERKRADDAVNQRISAEAGKAEAIGRAAEVERKIEEHQSLITNAKSGMLDAFKVLANDALKDNSSQFLGLARDEFVGLKKDAGYELDARKTAIDALISPIRESLVELKKETQELEKARLHESGFLKSQLETIAETERRLQSETSNLVNALKSTKTRGRWGEIALQNILELAGMTEGIDFELQKTVAGETGMLRPDVVVKLPNDQCVVIDAKVPLEGYLAALESEREEDRKTALIRHAAQFRSHVKQLSSKEYSKEFKHSPEYVVMFIPNDSFLVAATEQDATLLENAMKANVVITTPTTLMALLRAVAYVKQQAKFQENAARVQELGQTMADRIEVLRSHFEDVGNGLQKAIDAFNKAVGSFTDMLLPHARKFKELGAGGKKELGSLEPVDKPPRILPPAAD